MIQLALAMTIWGTLGIFALWSGLSAMELAFYRCLIGAGLLGIYSWKKGYFVHTSISRTNIFYALLSGIFIVLNWICLFKSFQWASITIGNVSYYLQPIFLVLLGILFFKESVRGKQWFYIVLTTIGVTLTSNPQLDLSESNQYMIAGIACAVGAGLLYAFSTIIVKFIKDMPPALTTLIQLGMGCLILLPWVNVLEVTHLSKQALINILIIGIIHTPLAYILYYQALKQVNLTIVAVLSYIDPVVAIITDIVFCNRTLNGWQITGILLTFIGSYQVIKLKQVKNIMPSKDALRYIES